MSTVPPPTVPPAPVPPAPVQRGTFASFNGADTSPDPSANPSPGSPWAPARRPVSALAVGAAVCALPVAPAGIVLSALALRDVTRRPVRGRGLAIASLVVSILMSLLGAVLSLGLLAAMGALVAGDPVAGEPGAPALDDPALAGRSVIPLPDEVPANCTHEPGDPSALVDWEAASLPMDGWHNVLIVRVYEASGALLGSADVDLARRGTGNLSGVARVPVPPQAVVGSCELGMEFVKDSTSAG